MAKKLKLLKSKKPLQPEKEKTAGTAVKKVVVSAGKVEPKRDPEKILNVGELDSLIGDAADAEADTRGFMQPQSTVKKRGRKSNAQKAAEAAQVQQNTTTSEAPPVVEEKLDCAPIAKMAWGLTNKWWVSYIGDQRASATEAEIDMLGAAWGKVLEKHLPTALANWGEEIIAMTVTVNIGLRISNSVQMLVEEKKAQREAYVARHAQSASQPQASAVQ